MIDDVIMLRAAEGILAILIGGLAIWCGFRLFLASFYFSINLKTQSGDRYSGLGQRANQSAFAPAATPASAVPRVDAAEMHLTLAFLSDIDAELAVNSTDEEKNWRARRFQVTKLAIIGRGWQPGWGDFAEFEIWLNEGSARAPRLEFERALAVMEGRD
jgi:hypothetical protein